MRSGKHFTSVMEEPCFLLHYGYVVAFALMIELTSLLLSITADASILACCRQASDHGKLSRQRRG
jgi:hypothetical protein